MAPCNVPLVINMKEPLRLEPLFPDRHSGEPLVLQLTRKLRLAIEAGALPPGTKVQGTRELARRLGLGRNTVAIAFEQLIAEGYLEARVGSGTFVARPMLSQPSKTQVTRTAKPTQADRIASLRSSFNIAAGSGPLRPGMPALDLFPLRVWKRCARRALSVYDGDLGYTPASGLRSLREAIALHVGQFRGISARAEQVIVVEGAQAALHLACTVLATLDGTVVLEDPCYALAKATFELHALHAIPVSVDDDGICTDRLPSKAQLAFVTPTHQFPLGGTLPLTRRLELIAWAAKRNAYILEDDYDSEFTSRIRPLPALQSLDRNDRVIYIGSFSKTLAPGIRAGYLIVPHHLADTFRAARATSSLGLSMHLQETLSLFIREGHFARHLRRMHAAYEERRQVLCDALEPLCRDSFKLGPLGVGLHIALVARKPFPDQDLCLLSDGQRLVTLSTLCLRRRDCFGFVLGFTNGTGEQIRRAAMQIVREMSGAGSAMRARLSPRKD